MTHTPFIFNAGSGSGHPIKQIMTAQTSNVTYAIQCQHCKLRIRIYEHLNQIRNANMETTLYAQFTLQGIQNFKYIGIESNPLWSINQRKSQEHIMIEKLSTITPKGLNEKP